MPMPVLFGHLSREAVIYRHKQTRFLDEFLHLKGKPSITLASISNNGTTVIFFRKDASVSWGLSFTSCSVVYHLRCIWQGELLLLMCSAKQHSSQSLRYPTFLRWCSYRNHSTSLGRNGMCIYLNVRNIVRELVAWICAGGDTNLRKFVSEEGAKLISSIQGYLLVRANMVTNFPEDLPGCPGRVWCPEWTVECLKMTYLFRTYTSKGIMGLS